MTPLAGASNHKTTGDSSVHDRSAAVTHDHLTLDLLYVDLHVGAGHEADEVAIGHPAGALIDHTAATEERKMGAEGIGKRARNFDDHDRRSPGGWIAPTRVEGEEAGRSPDGSHGTPPYDPQSRSPRRPIQRPTDRPIDRSLVLAIAFGADSSEPESESGAIRPIDRPTGRPAAPLYVLLS